MDRTCSIAEARNDLSGVVREAEAGRRPRLAEAIERFRVEHAETLDDADRLPSGLKIQNWFSGARQGTST